MGKDEETFESLYTTLEEKARLLEEGGLSLEDSVQAYEEGASVAIKLRALLDKAELRVRELDESLGESELELEEDDAGYDLEFVVDDDA